MVKRKNKKTHYLNNKEFEGTIKNYLENPTKYESELVEKLDLLISNIIFTFKFKIDPDDAKQECFMLAFKILKNFDKERGSAFNYFTTVFVNNLKLMYTKNKKYKEKIIRYQELKDPDYIRPVIRNPVDPLKKL